MEEEKWPTIAKIREAQERESVTSTSATGLKRSRLEQLVTAENAKWIPDRCLDLKLRLCIIAYSPSAGQGATLKAMENRYFCKDMKSDVYSFARQCTLCLTSIGGY